MDFWISKWISGFLDFRLDFWISDWISGFQIGFPPTVYEISLVTDPSTWAARGRIVGVAVDHNFANDSQKTIGRYSKALHLSFRRLRCYAPALEVARLGPPAPGVYPTNHHVNRRTNTAP